MRAFLCKRRAFWEIKLMGKEIERKFLVKALPEGLERYPVRLIEQGYLSTNPVVRVRRDNADYYLTYKGRGFLEREEYNLPLSAEAYTHLLAKADGTVIRKRRYELPLGAYTAELDVFEGVHAGLLLVEVEFPSVEAAKAFAAPAWFGAEVTCAPEYSNARLSQEKAHL